MRDANRRGWTVTVLLAMALGGAVIQMRGAVLPTLETAFGTPEWQLGLVAPAGTLGYVAAVLVTGFGAGHVAPRRLVVLGLVGGGVSVAVMGIAPVFAVFALGVALQGALNGVLRGVNRPMLSHLYPDARGRMYSFYDMAWAVGATAGPLLVLAALTAGDWRLAFFGVAAVWLALGIVTLSLSEPGIGTGEAAISVAEIRPLLARPPVLAMVAALVFAVGVEASLFTWLPIYASRTLPATATVGLAGSRLTVGLPETTLSIMLAGYVPGRFVYGSLAGRVGYGRLLGVISIVLLPAYATTFLVLDGLAVLPGVFVVGVLISGLHPLFLTFATEAAPEHSGPITGIAATTAATSFGVIPALLGGVITLYGASLAMALLLVPLVGVLAVVALAGFDGR